MNSSARTRIALAVIIVMLPLAMIYWYQNSLHRALDLPGAWALLSQPLVVPAENSEGSEKPPLESPVTLTSAKIASGKEITTPAPRPDAENEETPMDTLEDPFQQADVFDDADAPKEPPNKVASIETETVENFEAPIQEETGNKLHAGIDQQGQLVPGLTLEMGEEEIKHLLRSKQAFLVVTVAEQRYLLTVTNRKNPFHNVLVGHLKDEQGLSERYITLPRAKLNEKDLDALDNQVVERTGLLAKPRYSLVFSEAFNSYLTGIQLAKAEQLHRNLAELRSHNVPMSMHGKIIMTSSDIEMIILHVQSQE